MAHRSECLHGWVAACQAHGVPCSDKFKLCSVLSDPVKVRVCWNACAVQQAERRCN